jgi:hypothetical protein
MHRLAYRTLSGGAQSFVLNWTVNVSGVNPTNGATYPAGVRFAELRRDAGSGAVSIQNQVTYAPGSGDGAAGRNIWMGSAAQDNQGNSAVGFSASSTSLFLDRLGGRLAGAPPTPRAGQATMFSGAGVQTDTTSRWGDYSAMSVDPPMTAFYMRNSTTPTTATSTGRPAWARSRFPAARRRQEHSRGRSPGASGLRSKEATISVEADSSAFRTSRAPIR